MIYLCFINLFKERLMKCWDDIKKGFLMILFNELKVFFIKEIGICFCVNVFFLGIFLFFFVKICVVFLLVIEYLFLDY